MTTITKYNPNRSRLTLFEDLFENFFNSNFEMPSLTYPYDIIESDDGFKLEYMLPGFKKKDISINVENSELVISGKREVNNEIKYHRKQSFFGEFRKAFVLPDDVETDKIDANFEDGILKLTIPKVSEKTKLSKMIEIN